MNIQLVHHACVLGCFQYFAITTNSGMNNLVHEYFQTYEVDLKGYHLEMGIVGQNVNAQVAVKNIPNFPSQGLPPFAFLHAIHASPCFLIACQQMCCRSF